MLLTQLGARHVTTIRSTMGLRTRAARLLCALAVVSVGFQVGCQAEPTLDDAIRLQSQGNYAASIPVLQALLAENGANPQVNYLYGRALSAAKQSSLAEWTLRKAAKDPAWRAQSSAQLAANALQSTNYESAIEYASVVLQEDPQNVDMLLLRAQARSRSRLFNAEAIEDADRALEIDPQNRHVMEPRILALINLERWDEVGAEIERLGDMIASAEQPDEWIEGWHCSSVALFAAVEEDMERSTGLWNDCLERFPAHNNVVTNAVTYFDELDDGARSREILSNAIEADPQAFEYRRELALRTRFAGYPDEAEQILIQGTEVAEPIFVPAAWQMLSKHYQDLGDNEAAVAALEKAIAASEEVGVVPSQLLFEYADALVLRGDMAGAREAAEQITVVPQRELILARIDQEEGDHDSALRHFEAAFTLWPDNPWARYFAALSAEEIGDFDRAMESYRYSIRIAADVTDARYRLGRLLAAQGDTDGAMYILYVHHNEAPLSLEGDVLAAELLARKGPQKDITEIMDRAAQTSPASFWRVLAGVSEGAAQRYGPAAAAQILERYGVKAPAPMVEERLQAWRKLIDFRSAAGTLDGLEAPVRAAVATQPDWAPVHALLGQWLERTGAPIEETRDAYARALALDPADPNALAGLARLTVVDDPARAVELFDGAAASSTGDAENLLSAARILQSLGRSDEAILRLEQALGEDIYSPKAALTLATIRLESGDSSERTLALAERAVRFGGGLPALDLLARTHRARGNVERATELESMSKQARTAQASAPAGDPEPTPAP